MGVISLHLFNGIAAGEAYCREAATIQTIGKLTESETIIIFLMSYNRRFGQSH